MRSFRVLATVLLAICLGAAPARSELYQWIDAQGRVHMTDDLSQVPSEHRGAADRAGRSSSSGASRRWNAVEVPTSAAPAAPQQRATTRAGQRHVLSVERGGESMIVRGVLNGSVTAVFVVDTGAMGCTVPRYAVEELGIRIDDSTPRRLVQGISGEVLEVPVVTINEVRVGTAVVRNVEMTVLDTMSEGLLGMTFFNHFKIQTDPVAGTLVLEEIDLNAIDGVYGGHSQSYWQRRFRALASQLRELREFRQQIPSTHVTKHERLDEMERGLIQQQDELQRKASAAGVPRAWRE